MTVYAKNLGLAFQIVGRSLDATGRAAEAGKDVGQDLKKTIIRLVLGGGGGTRPGGRADRGQPAGLAPFGTVRSPSAIWRVTSWQGGGER